MNGNSSQSRSRVPKSTPGSLSSAVSAPFDLLAGLAAAEKSKNKRAKALAALSALSLVGAVSLAPAVNDEALSREIRQGAGEELKALLG